MQFDWVKPFLMEQKVADIISDQAKHGCNFDVRMANWYVHVLTERILKIDIELIPRLPMMMNKANNHYKKPFKLNGQFMSYVQKYCDRVGLKREEVGGPFTPVWYTPFDPSKVDALKKVMMDYGWMPTEWNQKKMEFNVREYRNKLNNTSFREFMTNAKPEFVAETLPLIDGFVEKHFKNKPRSYMVAVLFALGFNTRRAPTFDQIKKKLLMSQYWPTSPKITEDSFDSMSGDDSEMLSLLRQRMMLSHRRSLIQGLLEKERDDGKLSGECNPCATPTARGKHRIIVNIPSGGAHFGKECRGLFRGDYNGVSPARVVKRTPDEKLDGINLRREPGTNRIQEFDKGKWKNCGYYMYYIHAGYDAFVGGDGAALELRMLAHYLVFACKMRMEEAKASGNAKAYLYYESGLKAAYDYREQILGGDIHTHNQKLAGLPTRASAKSFILIAGILGE